VSVARSLERRLERLIEGVAGRVFSGRLHPSELAGKLAREADFARFPHATGPATANLFVVQVNPKDITVDATQLEEILAKEMTEYTAEEGLRLEGPVEVKIEPVASVAAGRAECHVEVAPGPPVVWARLTSKTESLDIGRNRVLIGRSPDADVVAAHDDISRRHALLHREQGNVFVRDLDSANGTTVDGSRVGEDPVPIDQGSVLTLGSHRYRFVEIGDA
jgi:hypothetical protein